MGVVCKRATLVRFICKVECAPKHNCYYMCMHDEMEETMSRRERAQAPVSDAQTGESVRFKMLNGLLVLVRNDKRSLWPVAYVTYQSPMAQI